MTRLLRLTDGTVTVDMLNKSGVFVRDWTPSVGNNLVTYQSSPLTDGRSPSSYKIDNATETMTADIYGETPDDIIQRIQELRRLLLQGLNYYTTNWQIAPVWLEARAEGETNIRYALVKSFNMPTDDNPYDSPFAKEPRNYGKRAMESITIQIEHGGWGSTRPGTGEAVAISSTQSWKYEASWAATAATSTDGVSNVSRRHVTKAPNGDIYYIEENTTASTSYLVHRIFKSDDNAQTFSAVYSAPLSSDGLNSEALSTIYAVSNTIILASDGNGHIYRTANAGSTWSQLGPYGDKANSFILLGNGNLLAAFANGTIYQSTDSGATWSLLVTVSNFGPLDHLFLTSGGRLYLTAHRALLESTDNGATWGFVSSEIANNNTTGGILHAISLSEDATGNLWASAYYAIPAYTNRAILKSINGGTNWQFVTASSSLVAPLHASDGSIYVVQDGNSIFFGGTSFYTTDKVMRSTDGGISFGEDYAVPSSFTGVTVSSIKGWVELDNGDIFALGIGPGPAASSTDDDQVVRLIKTTGDSVQLGRVDSESERVIVGNKQCFANLTHIKIDDGGSFTDIYPMTAYPVDLLPSSIALNDAAYFGVRDDILNSGPFSSLVANLSSILTYSDSITTVWEYYNGSIWASLTVQDGSAQDDGSRFVSMRRTGLRTIHWQPPNNWATTTVDGVSGWWVRLRISALTGTATPPKQQVANIFTATNGYFEVAKEAVAGDLASYARLSLSNISDFDGSTAPILYSSRVMVALRSKDRGDSFQAFVNLSDRQNPPGLTISTSNNATLVDDPTAPSGQRVNYAAAAGDTTWADRASLDISSKIVQDFYGTFHVYVRGQQATGSAGDIQVRIQIKTSSGGVTFTTPPVTFSGTNDFELLDFDALTIPAGQSILNIDELGDVGTITIQARNVSGASRTVKFYDLVFMPTDEWVGDFADPVNSGNSIIGRQGGIQHYLEIDSITNPRRTGRAIVREDAANNKISAIYEYVANGKAMLQCNRDQRLWVLSARYGSNGEWISDPSVAWSVTAQKQQRYLSMRGAR